MLGELALTGPSALHLSRVSLRSNVYLHYIPKKVFSLLWKKIGLHAQSHFCMCHVERGLCVIGMLRSEPELWQP